MKRFLSVLLCLCMVAAMMPTFVLAENTNAPASIKILGMEMTDGDYLASNDATEVSEDYEDGDEYVALYKDGILKLNGLDIVNEDSDDETDRCIYWDYDAAGNDDLVIELVSGTTNTVIDEGKGAICGATGVDSGPSLTIQGNGTLNVTGATYGIWVWQDIVIKNGAVVNIIGETKSGISNNSSAGSIIVKQGTTVNVSGYEYGVSSDNSAIGNFVVQGGELTVKGNTAAVNKVSSDFEGNTVYVGSDVTGTGSAVWDDITDITTYKYISLSGFSDTVTTYAVETAATTNGSISVDFAESMADETVTITAAPDTDYEVDSITVTDGSNADVPVFTKGNVATFTMPAEAVTVVATFKAVVKLADYTALSEAYAEGATYSNADETYTAVTFGKLTEALAAADLPANKELTVQDDVDALTKAINDAIAGLVRNVKVSFTAVAVADDASEDYAKANKIVLVFAEPVNDTANVLVNKLNIANEVVNAVWTTNTVYTLSLDEEHGLKNNAKVEFNGDETIFTVAGDAMADADATVVGNLEEAYQQVTATNMTATIVKASAKPGVQAGDKVVLVFNAPVYGNPSSLTVNGKTANAVAGTSNTVYEIKMATGDSIAAPLEYKDAKEKTITALSIFGSFGEAIAPVVTRALAVDNNGNATTEGDNIIITFDRPTNGDENIDLSGIIRNSGYFIGDDYKANWNDEKTELTITLGEYATLIDGLKINLGNLGITDIYGTADYEGVDIKIAGSFGTTVAPKITRAIAFTQNNKHIIRVFFNTEVTVSGAMSVYIENFDDDNAQGKWSHNGISYYDMTLGDNHDAFVTNQYVIKFEGTLLDSETLKSSVVDASATIRGGFEQDIEPEILSFTAYSNDGSGMAKEGDKLVLVFNSSVTDVKSEGKNFVSTDGGVTWIYELSKDNEVNTGDLVKFTVKALGNTKEMSANIGGSFGYKADLQLLSATAVNPDATGLVKGGEIYVAASLPIKQFVAQGLGTVTPEDTHGTIWKIKLDDNAVVKIGDELEFHITNAITNESEVLSVKLTGSFGYYVAPEVIKATAYSKDGCGIAKENDTVIVTFNTAVDPLSVSVTPKIGAIKAISSTDNYNFVITLGAAPTVAVGDELSFTATSLVTGETKTIENVKLGGSFGYKVTPEVVSATAYSNDGSGVAKAGDVVVVVFNTPVKATVAATYGDAAQADTYGNVWKITLASNSGAEVGKKFAINVTSVATGETVALNPELGGSFGSIVVPELISATAYSNDGSGVAKAGDKIVLVFNTPVSGVTSALGTMKDVKDSTIWEITLTSTNVNVDDELVFNVTALANSTAKEVTAKLGGSFGAVVEPSIKSVTAISNDGSGVAKVGDRIVVVFDTEVRVGADDAEATYVYTYTLTSADIADETYALENNYSVDVWSVATGAKYKLEAIIGGSYGYSEAPAVKSVILTESGLKEIITVVFDQATTMNDINTSKLFASNEHLGQTVTAAWINDTVLKITLADDAVTTADSKLNLSGLGIKSKATNVDVEGIDALAITGSLVPVVTEAAVDGKVITIKFSARTNGSSDTLAKIEAQTVLYGTGVKAKWADNNRELVITMGADNALPVDAYIVLNALGITDGFSNTVEVTGQYAIDTKLLDRNLLGVMAFVKGVNTENAERTDYTAGLAGDQILVVFDAPTNKVQGADAKANVGLSDGKSFGTDYTAVWTSDSLITITLGEGATVTTEDKLIVKDVKFANGTGRLSDDKADETVEELEGQFDGRQFWIEDLKAATIAGLKRYSATIKQAPMTVLNKENMPFVICQGYDAKDKVVAISAMQISGAYTQDVSFDFNNSSLTKIDMFVVSGDYADADAVVTVYSETESK